LNAVSCWSSFLGFVQPASTVAGYEGRSDPQQHGGHVRNADGFDEFYRGTRVRVLQFLYAACGDLGEAQDAAQEAYTRAWQRWGTVGRSADPEVWIRVVGWRIIANGWRKQRSSRANSASLWSCTTFSTCRSRRSRRRPACPSARSRPGSPAAAVSLDVVAWIAVVVKAAGEIVSGLA
jgi:DNA-directed RNA polymerase specialized sigma24 family protein